MSNVLLIVHILLALGLIGIVLLQRNEGGGLGIGGGGGGMSGFMTGRSSANFLTRMTAILAGLFMVTSLALTMLLNSGREGGSSLTDQLRGAGTPGTQSEEGAPPEAGGATPAPTPGGSTPQVE